MEFTLLGALAVAVGAIWLALRLRARGRTVPAQGFERLIAAATAGLFAGRLAAMIGAGTNPILHPLDIIVVRSGVSTVVASLTAVGFLLWDSRRQLPAVPDALAPAALAGLAGWHAGCLVRGTCLGSVSDLPWAWAQPGSDLTRHPVELYAAALLLVGAWLVARFATGPWVAATAAVAVAGGARLVTEPLRPSLGGGPWVYYLMAVIVGVAGSVWAIGRSRRSRPVVADHP